MIRPWQKRRTSKVKSKPRVTAVPNKPFEKQKTEGIPEDKEKLSPKKYNLSKPMP